MSEIIITNRARLIITRALETLMIETVEERAAMIAKGRRCERVGTESMLVDGRVRVGAMVHARTHERDELVTSFVHHERAHLTLQSFKTSTFKNLHNKF